MPTLLYIGENPGHGTGTPVIILRHLRRFAAQGWRIIVVAEYSGDYALCHTAGWTVRRLSHRRWWWPPFRPHAPLLRWLRFRLLARQAIGGGPAPDVILSYLAAHAPFSAELATHVAQLTGAPLHTLVHDDAAAFPDGHGRELELRREHEAILRAADVCWFASPELAHCFPAVSASARVLYPIPEGWPDPAVWHETRTRVPRIHYAGYLWPQQLPLLARIAQSARQAGGEFVLITRQTLELQAFCAEHNIAALPSFPTNREALAHLVADSAGLVVSYAETTAMMPWSATSFPSKLIEYCHLGLPIAIIAPPDTAVARWAQRARFPDFFVPSDQAGVRDWVAGLRDARRWQERAAVSLRLARTEFNPERIQAELVAALLAGTEQRAA
jgi:hypothetical protein